MRAFRQQVAEMLRASAVPERLAARAAVVLERIARGGGATNWYRCARPGELMRLVENLRPGSVVSFYFDDRMCQVTERGELAGIVGDAIASCGECVVGVACDDGGVLDVDFVRSSEQLQEFLDEHALARMFVAGAFPGRDNDDGAVTIILPDVDGVVRAHPH